VCLAARELHVTPRVCTFNTNEVQLCKSCYPALSRDAMRELETHLHCVDAK